MDVIQENERKRKRAEGDGEMEVEVTATSQDSVKQAKPSKKPRTESRTTETLTPSEDEAIRLAKREKRKQKREEKKARKEEQQAAQQAKKQKKADAVQNKDDAPETAEYVDTQMEPLDVSGLGETEDKEEHVWEEASSDHGRADQDDDENSTATPSEKDDSPAFDFSAQPSGTSSVSSTGTVDAPAPPKAKNKQPKPLKGPTAPVAVASGEAELTDAQKHERLRKRLAELRAARKADVDGHPARTRAELLESRRKKTDTRKEKKKALRQQAKEEEQKQREEAIARGSPLMSPSVRSSPPREEENNFAFGRVAFENGQAMTADLSGLLDVSKRKGPSDLKTAVQAADAKKARLSGLDPAKRADIAEKDMWLAARKHAHGERPRDDQNLLKKALKRKEKEKSKSATEWYTRTEGVKVGKEKRQKKREQNLAKRKEEKGKKGGSKGSKPKKTKKRPGFEGSFRAGGKK